MNDIAELMLLNYGRSFGYAFLENFLLGFMDDYTGKEFDTILHILTEAILLILAIKNEDIPLALDSHE